jgi:hypothetical protein
VARTYSDDAKPLVSRGYGKIVFLTLMAMLVGCGLMAWEIWGDYGGATQAVRTPPVKVPAALPPAEKGPPATNP